MTSRQESWFSLRLRWAGRVLLLLPPIGLILYSVSQGWNHGSFLPVLVTFVVPLLIIGVIGWFIPLLGGLLAIALSTVAICFTLAGLEIDRLLVFIPFGVFLGGGILSFIYGFWKVVTR